MLNYLVRYEYEHDFTKTKQFKILGPFKKPMTWRELQKHFDLAYNHNYLEFFPIGEKIESSAFVDYQDFYVHAIN